MKNVFVVMLFFLVILSGQVYAQGILDASWASLELNIHNEVQINGDPGNFEYVNAVLLWFPETDRQQYVSLAETTPESVKKDNGYYFMWKRPLQKHLQFSLDSRIKTTSFVYPVQRRITFPLSELDKSLSKYTLPSERADIDEDIRTLGNNLAKDKYDLYEVVFTIADWVTSNIQYNLSTMNLEASFPSTEVLQSRNGVCDEMTNLFISLLRSVGIPARFVSGLAYTNEEFFGSNWVPHGWAEVYFPGVGWVPFDVTYGEYGFLDAGHITLKHSIDSLSSTATADSRESAGSISLKRTEFNVTIHTKEALDFSKMQLSVDPVEKEVAPGSFDVIHVKAKNLAPYYVSTRITMNPVKHLFIEDNVKNILLKPKESKDLFFLVKVDDLLNPEYTYEFPIVLVSRISPDINSSFVVKGGAKSFESGYFHSFMSKDNLAGDVAVGIDCTDVEGTAGKNININCSFVNNLDYAISGEACIQDDCQTLMLDANQLKQKTFKLMFDNAGIKSLKVSFDYKEGEASRIVQAVVNDAPTISILDINAPSEIKYGDDAEISFRVRKESSTTPKHVNVIVEHPRFRQEFSEQDISEDHVYRIKFKGKDLSLGENLLSIKVVFSGESGETYVESKDVEIALVDVNLFQRILLWIDKAGRAIGSIF